MPELVHLYGADEARNDPASDEDFRSILARIPPEPLVYRMHGEERRGAEKLYIGSVTIESEFVASAFGDCILAFRHAWKPEPSSA